MNVKRILSLALVLVMVMSLAACGGGNDPTGGKTETTAPTQSGSNLTT